MLAVGRRVDQLELREVDCRAGLRGSVLPVPEQNADPRHSADRLKEGDGGSHPRHGRVLLLREDGSRKRGEECPWERGESGAQVLAHRWSSGCRGSSEGVEIWTGLGMRCDFSNGRVDTALNIRVLPLASDPTLGSARALESRRQGRGRNALADISLDRAESPPLLPVVARLDNLFRRARHEVPPHHDALAEGLATEQHQARPRPHRERQLFPTRAKIVERGWFQYAVAQGNVAFDQQDGVLEAWIDRQHDVVIVVGCNLRAHHPRIGRRRRTHPVELSDQYDGTAGADRHHWKLWDMSEAWRDPPACIRERHPELQAVKPPGVAAPGRVRGGDAPPSGHEI